MIIDGTINEIVWDSLTQGEASVTVNTRHDNGEYGLDSAVWHLLRKRVGKLALKTLVRVATTVTGESEHCVVRTSFVTR